MKKLFKKALIAAALAMPVLSYAAATPIMFDSNGAAAGGQLTIDTLDWAPGNALAVNGNPTTGLLLPGTQTQLLYQANLGLASLNGVTVYAPPLSGFNFTAVAGFNEVVISNTTGLNPTFGLASAPVRSATNFFYIYANAFGDNLTGLGFVGSTLALSGYVASVNSSNFTGSGTVANPTIAPLDNFGANNYPGISTLVGSGTTDLVLVVDGISAFFPTLTPGTTLSFFNTSTLTPFSTANPSALFSSNGTVGANTASNTGAINGVRLPGDTAQHNFQFLADGSSSFQQVQKVPEPGSLALVGLALGIAGFMRRRTAKKA